MSVPKSSAASRLPRRVTAAVVAAIVSLGLAPGLAPGLARAETSPPQTVALQIPDGQIDKAVASLDEIAAALVRRSGIPGMSVAVVRDGKVVYAKGFGVRKVGDPALVDADTVFQIASLSKSVSSTVVAQQVGAGVVQWNTPVIAHLPWFKLNDPWVSRHVTIADLFSHRSGLPDHAGDDLEDLGYGRRAVLERLRLLPLASFRDTYAYTNFGLTAAAESVAAAAHTDWETLCENVLFKPLGMTSTSTRFSDFVKRADRAHGHVKIDGAYQPRFQREPDAQSPAGGVSSTANDLARWMTLVLQNGRYEDRQLIPAAALLPAIRAEVISSPSFAPDARPGFYGYGIGVSITAAGRVSLSHSGAFAMGAATAYSMLPSAGVGIVILTNAAPIGVAESVAAEFMDRVQFGQSERDWYAAYAPLMQALMTPAGTLSGKTPSASPKPAAQLAAYAGRYESAYFGTAVIAVAGDGLELKLGPAEKTVYRLSHWDGDTFAFTPSGENATNGSRAALIFTRAGKGQAGKASAGKESMGKGAMADFTIDYLDENGLGRFARR